MKDKIKLVVLKSLDLCGIKTEVKIENTKDLKNGEYTTNVALTLTKQLKKAPHVIALEIVDKMDKSLFEKVEVAGPGFINFYMKKDYLYENLNEILVKLDEYGKCNIGNNKKINIEFVSANPTGTLHLGHARGASNGDALANLLSYVGYDVTREYYVNDGGNQINNLAYSIKARYDELCNRDFEIPEDGYYGNDIVEIAKDILSKYGNNLTDIEFFKDLGVNILLTKWRFYGIFR